MLCAGASGVCKHSTPHYYQLIRKTGGKCRSGTPDQWKTSSSNELVIQRVKQGGAEGVLPGSEQLLEGSGEGTVGRLGEHVPP